MNGGEEGIRTPALPYWIYVQSQIGFTLSHRLSYQNVSGKTVEQLQNLTIFKASKHWV